LFPGGEFECLHICVEFLGDKRKCAKIRKIFSCLLASYVVIEAGKQAKQERKFSNLVPIFRHILLRFCTQAANENIGKSR
jgi:hypothetical protein